MHAKYIDKGIGSMMFAIFLLPDHIIRTEYVEVFINTRNWLDDFKL